MLSHVDFCHLLGGSTVAGGLAAVSNQPLQKNQNTKKQDLSAYKEGLNHISVEPYDFGKEHRELPVERPFQ